MARPSAAQTARLEQPEILVRYKYAFTRDGYDMAWSTVGNVIFPLWNMLRNPVRI